MVAMTADVMFHSDNYNCGGVVFVMGQGQQPANNRPYMWKKALSGIPTPVHHHLLRLYAFTSGATRHIAAQKLKKGIKVVVKYTYTVKVEERYSNLHVKVQFFCGCLSDIFTKT